MKNQSYSRFLVVWAGQLFSGLGTGMTAFSLGIFVFEKTNSTTSFAWVILSLFLPSILLAPLGGILADRFDRRLMIVIGDTGSALSVLSLLGCLLSGVLSMWMIYLGVAIGSSFAALQGPAYKASVSDLLTESQFAKAGGLMQLAASTRHLISPVAAGVLFTISGLKTVLLIDATTFGLAVGAALCIPANVNIKQQRDQHQLLKEMKEGWEILLANRKVTKVILALAIVTFYVGYIQTLFTPMILAITDVKNLGAIQSVSALGMLVGSLQISFVGLKRDVRFQLSIGIGCGGVCLVALGMGTNLILITTFLFLFFLCLPLINTSAEVLIRTGISVEKQGRVWGITSLLSQTGYLVAYLSAGFLSDRIFSPLLSENGLLAATVGRVIGTGPGRGNAFILMICGTGLILTSIRGRKNAFV
ncbi:MAG: MFS transporter [Spirochaetales bacterium]|nr:MFS transporter [Spirochaetales bacterium]